MANSIETLADLRGSASRPAKSGGQGRFEPWPTSWRSLRVPRNLVARSKPWPFGGRFAPREIWWPRAELNHRHKDFQSSALPTELLGQGPNYSSRTRPAGTTSHAEMTGVFIPRTNASNSTSVSSGASSARKWPDVSALPRTSSRRVSNRRIGSNSRLTTPFVPHSASRGQSTLPPRRARGRSSPPRGSPRRSRGSSPGRAKTALVFGERARIEVLEPRRPAGELLPQIVGRVGADQPLGQVEGLDQEEPVVVRRRECHVGAGIALTRVGEMSRTATRRTACG